VDDGTIEAVVPKMCSLCEEMKGQLNDDRRGEIVRSGIQVAIVGPPNAGKSTLLNVLAGRPAAIVSAQAGTTRDVVEVSMDLNGIPIIVRDTAGIREHTEDEIELEGMRRAREAAASADIIVLVQDASSQSFVPASAVGRLIGELRDGAESALERRSGKGLSDAPPSNWLVVANKMDLRVGTLDPACAPDNVFYASLAKGDGVDELLNGLERAIRRLLECDARDGGEGVGTSARDAPVITRARHRYHVERATEALDAFIAGRSGPKRDQYLPMDLATEELRLASRELGSITGIIHVEEVLDVIFKDFCIGK
jgi:tRNA modification GTPase